MSVAEVLHLVVQQVIGDDHLPECTRRRRPVMDCDWCRWAVRTRELEQLVALALDARALLDADAADGVPGAVAYRELRVQFDDIDVGAVRVPAARRVAAAQARATATELDRLGAAVARAARPDGPVDLRCRATAGALAVLALREDPACRVPDSVPEALVREVRAADESLSTALHVATLAPVLERTHWNGLPPLVTQPEWARRPSAQAATGLAAGSLEALVVESVADRCTDELLRLGAELARFDARCRLARPRRGRWSRAVRSTVWRRLRVDWHATFVDTGLADCWGARTVGDHEVVDVPWTVSLAIDVAGRHGLDSATHQRPDPD